VRFATADEAANLPLRKESMRVGTLRLIEIPEFDLSACGGTHVARTGAIGSIVVASSERFRGGTRVEFLCGGRAVRGYRALRDAMAGSVRLVSVLPSELPGAIERLQAELKDSKRQLKDLRTRLAGVEAAGLADRAEVIAAGESITAIRTVIAAVDGFDQAGLKDLAASITLRRGYLAALFSTTPPIAAVVARGSDVNVDCASILKELIERFGGKGGGRPELAQGGGLQGSASEIIDVTRQMIR
jgi:alanyl-tRNA synthetase